MSNGRYGEVSAPEGSLASSETHILSSVSGEVATLFGIVGYVLTVAWVSRRIALDMDARGKSGWVYGVMTLFVPPLGIGIWLLDRNRPATRSEWRPQLGSFADLALFAVLILTFPWGLLIWLFLNRKTSPQSHAND
jgi:hypothetical protein